VAQQEPETIEEATVAGSSKTAKGGTAAAKTAEKTTPETGKPLSGLSGLSGLQGGPKSGPGSQTAGGSAGQPLDSGTIQRTVSRYTGSVKRSCWQPALDTRSRDAPTSARVNVTITVGASGGVQSVSTSGEPSGYRGLASCIAGRVRGWQFPASSGTTTVNVPFVFAAQ
jgi:TonB family protein